ncbi:glycoside hydrolase family 38 C-terminal domain-containing protein, partial [Paenibacillus riograndensis]|uniref:glycoside hydrolase family 38 C-terminal domain-containing protein n=1 Tax=Paenibacillus riograndensis TaxID=483937 RepID=UPI0005930966
GPPASPLTLTESGMANNFLAVHIREDGSYDVTDKRTGRVYEAQGIYEDYGDIGNEYVFRQPEGDVPLTTRGVPARISLVEHEAYRITYEIVHEWEIPASAEASFEEEKRKMVPFRQRKAGRSSEQAPLRIVTRVSLEAGGQGVQVTAAFNNQAKDHRLRVLFPTGLAAATHLVDSVFEAAERDINPAPDWINPSNAQHQQAFVSVSDGMTGFTVANKGLNEYEVLRDGKNTIAITLLRSVSELGDWGVFPTPEAQCLGEHTVEFALCPHAGDAVQSEAFAWAYQYQTPWFAVQTGWQQGSLPAVYQPLEWQGRTLALSAFKMSAAHEDIILRWYNLAHKEQEFTLKAHFPVEAVYASDILERRKPPEQLEEGMLRKAVGPAQIVTCALNPLHPQP